MLICIINSSSLVSDADVATMTEACQIQNTLHCAPAWNMSPATIKFYPKGSVIPNWGWLISIIDDDSSVPNALGWHTVDTSDDRIIGYIVAQPVLSNGGVALYDAANPQNVSVASVLAHECCEAFLDRFCNFWADGPEISQGSEYALEVCDPCEDISYIVKVGEQSVSVSDFIFPSWCNVNSKSPQHLPLDYCNKLTAPFTLTSGGYFVVRNGPGSEQQVFGREMPQWKRDMKSNSTFRRFNRRDQKVDKFFAKLWKWLVG